MNLENFTKGWIIGNFSPSLFKTKDIEIAIKAYKSGDKEKTHIHKIATEYTIVITGTIKMLNNIYTNGEIVIIHPNVKNQFECIEDAILLVIKTPSVIGDKYEV